MSKVRILCLSDVAIGYGSSQIQHLTKSIADKLDADEVLIVYPDQKRREDRKPLYPEFKTERIVTRMPSYHASFAIEFNNRLISIIEEWKPSIVIATHGWVLPAVLKCRDQGFHFIYYMLECLSHQIEGIGDWAKDLNKEAFETADIVITPEKNRLEHDIRQLETAPKTSVEIFNVGLQSIIQDGKPRSHRSATILSAGSIGDQVLSDYMLYEQLDDISFTIAGPADFDSSRNFVDKTYKKQNISYVGLLPSDEVLQLRSGSAYSLVIWNPENLNQLFACPNKFFESIASGTPVVTAPHPQCADIVSRYNCGIVMKDWTKISFCNAIYEAIDIFNNYPDRYDDMVENCKKAAEQELNWSVQFQKFENVWF